MTEAINPHRASPAFEETSGRKYDEDMDVKQMLTRNETLLWNYQVQRDAEVSRQLELLQVIRDELVSQATPLQFISNAVIQIIFVATAFIFGIFTVYGMYWQVNGIYLSTIQNQMSMVAFCHANDLVRIGLTHQKNLKVNICARLCIPTLAMRYCRELPPQSPGWQVKHS
jgi:hypothetical protein